MADELSFRAVERPAPSDPGPMVALLLLVIAVIAVSRPLWQGEVPRGTVVEVRGEVPRPGHHLVEPSTVEAALAAAGVATPPIDPRPVPPGHQVTFDGSRAVVAAPSDPLLVGLPIDIDAAEPRAFEAIPGIGEKTAHRIVADRAARGPFRSIDDLSRVPGVNPVMVERMRPFVVHQGVATIDLNTAPAPRLELLDGIGPVLAKRIVEYRGVHGPFDGLEGLADVPGIRRSLIRGLDGELVVGP